MNSLRDEIEFMFSGQGMPYHKVSMVLAVFIAVIFTVVYSNNYIKEADVAVIDIDNSRFSRSFIEDLDASPFIHIKNVYQTPQNPDKLMYHDEHIAVLYIPHDFEKSVTVKLLIISVFFMIISMRPSWPICGKH